MNKLIDGLIGVAEGIRSKLSLKTETGNTPVQTDEILPDYHGDGSFWLVGGLDGHKIIFNSHRSYGDLSERVDLPEVSGELMEIYYENKLGDRGDYAAILYDEKRGFTQVEKRLKSGQIIKLSYDGTTLRTAGTISSEFEANKILKEQLELYRRYRKALNIDYHLEQAKQITTPQ